MSSHIRPQESSSQDHHSPIITMEMLSLAVVSQKVVCLWLEVEWEGKRLTQARLSRIPWSPLGHPLAGHSEPSPSCWGKA